MSDHSPLPEGYELPLAGALTQPILIMGLPRDYAIFMGTIALVLGLALKIWWLGILWWLCSHGLGHWCARTDPQFLDVLRRHVKLPGHLGA